MVENIKHRKYSTILRYFYDHNLIILLEVHIVFTVFLQNKITETGSL